MSNSGCQTAQNPHFDLPGLVEKIEANWPVLPSGIWNSSSIRTLSRHLHKLSRHCKQFKLADLLELATVIDEQISDIIELNTPPDSRQIDSLNDLLRQLNRRVHGIPDSDTAHDVNKQIFDLLYLPRNQDDCELITTAASIQHWQHRLLSDLQELREFLTKHRAKAALIDASFLPKLSQNLDLLGSVKTARPGLFFVSDHYDIETRLQALRAGAKQLFSEPIDIETVVTTLGEQIRPTTKPQYRVLIVEDDESQAKFAANLLHKGGLETLAITEPLGVIDAVRRFQPDLILMDLYMPGADGIELTRLIRDKAETVAIPIVFLSGEDDMEKKLLALQSGADDFLTKPIRPQQLLATVKTRIERSKAVSASGIMATHDDTTGLPTRRELLSQLDLMRAGFSPRPQCHALLALSLSDPQTDPDAWSEGDAGRRIKAVVESLKPILDTEDYLARIGYLNLALLIHRPTEQEVKQLADLMYDRVRRTVSNSTHSERTAGIGLILLDGTTQGAYEQLDHAESSAFSAYQQGLEGYLVYGETAPTCEEPAGDGQTLRRDQFLHTLQTGEVTLQEQRFTSRPGSNRSVETIELMPKLVSTGKADNPYQIAAECGATAKFDRFVSERAVGRLGEYALQGKLVRLIFRQSALVLGESDYVERTKRELRKLQILGTGLMIEFDLPTLASDLKRARSLFRELAALGIAVSLGSFICNETAYKVLAYLKADAVRPHLSLLRVEAEKIQHISAQIHALHAEVILPRVERHGQIALQWSESADYIQADFSQ
jgi:PleD family two-component response regulator/EAL domain-containing protein (putative c-di-GMP-specific phosphodiesterase class I)